MYLFGVFSLIALARYVLSNSLRFDFFFYFFHFERLVTNLFFNHINLVIIFQVQSYLHYKSFMNQPMANRGIGVMVAMALTGIFQRVARLKLCK